MRIATVLLALSISIAGPASAEPVHRLGSEAAKDLTHVDGKGGPVIIAYVFSRNKVLDPSAIAAGKLTHINYAFANIADGRIIEGFTNDAKNFEVLSGLRTRNPKLQILISVGGWTWSGGFSDMALTSDSRRRFVDSALEFVRRHNLDGVDIDWEYPDPESLRLKCNYILAHKLGGVMFWEYYADPTGSLLDALYRQLRAR